MRSTLPSIRRGLVAFWAVWFVIVFATNTCDGLKSLQFLPQYWMFASGNYAFVRSVTERYVFSETFSAVLFAGVILWQGLACLLFWRAVWLLLKQSDFAAEAVRLAFACGIALWGAFVLADEIFIAYAVEAAHMRLFIAQLVSLIFLEFVSDNHHGEGQTRGDRGRHREMGSIN